MNTDIILSNLSNPTLLFFVLGIFATVLKSDLEIPASSSKFISLYLLFSIGFKGGQELAHSGLNEEILITLLVCIGLAALVPLYTFFILKRKLSVENAGAIAATYGSVSAVTFVTATLFLDTVKVTFGGHMVAAMALMEAPAIVIGVLLMRTYSSEKHEAGLGHLIKESLTNGSVLMICGSLLIGIISDAKGAEGIKPFTTDIFKGFLAIFLLEMGMVAARRFGTFRNYGLFVSLFALFIPVINGVIAVFITSMLPIEPGNRLLVATLASSASYIAVPAAMRQIAPKADPGLYIPMALGITFPFNISLGLPLYWMLIEMLPHA
ncbi:MAG: sodium-dependent bicarbonate transport family permease [Chitinophagaceae bacterium]|nr:sodium-dependent bicarbonate transport family permease [Chitinophagaceae bacterium]